MSLEFRSSCFFFCPLPDDMLGRTRWPVYRTVDWRPRNTGMQQCTCNTEHESRYHATSARTIKFDKPAEGRKERETREQKILEKKIDGKTWMCCIAFTQRIIVGCPLLYLLCTVSVWILASCCLQIPGKSAKPLGIHSERAEATARCECRPAGGWCKSHGLMHRYEDGRGWKGKGNEGREELGNGESEELKSKQKKGPPTEGNEESG